MSDRVVATPVASEQEGRKTPTIELNGVLKRYGAKIVVHDVDLRVRSGECLVLVGHNGAGKTTLMKIMLGLTRVSAGRVRVLGDDPSTASSVARRNAVGFLPESVAFHEAMTGREVLAFYARLKGEPVEDCQEALARVGLGEAATRPVRTYSKGMRQRLGLAQAILGQPRLLLLDEPTSGLDPALRRQFYEIIAALRTAGTTTLISSHALNEVEARADRVAILQHGALVACGTVAELGAQAALPLRFLVSSASNGATQVAERLGITGNARLVNGHTVDLTCSIAEKMEIVRRIADLGSLVRDVDILPPRLDEIYLHYTSAEQPR